MALNPYDLEEEILARVTWKYLATLRCACKLWNSLILEERRNKKNLSFHMHSYSGEHRFILLDTDRGPKISAVGIEEQQNNVDDPPSLINWAFLSTVEDNTLTKVRPCEAIKLYRAVHCDGLLLYVMENQLLVRNPLLKETTWIKCGSDFHQRDDAYSLGYLSHCDFRILRFRCASNSRNRPSRVEVCEVASKTWKVIDNISFDWFLSVPLSILSLRGTPYCIGLREDHTAFVQSYDFSGERFQPIDDLPFSYDEMNPIALEIYKGDRLSVLEQCHKTRKICIWVKHWLMLTSWTKLVVVDIPEFPLLYPRPSLINFYELLFRQKR
ncbi:unnamed protein product [Brassica rapa subsp. narinosa]|uniref:(rape) hypothetical protein n=2 Tax=Brassica TaxID=3705 RepID=A0A816PCP9_BRANA|nr:unnamed protein product [Brassica napus]